MSAMHDDFSDAFVEDGRAGETQAAATPVVVHRRAGVAAVIGAAASAVAIAYLWRAAQSMAVLDWTLFAVMAVVAGYYLASLVDARTPLLVADDLGVRIRLGHEWRGLPWEAIDQVVVHPRTGLLRDGRLVVAPRNLTRALEGLDARARRHVALNQKMYGAPLAVPLGSTTRTNTAGDHDVSAGVAGLALGRSEVVELDPRTLEVVEHAAEDAGPPSNQPNGEHATARDADHASTGESVRQGGTTSPQPFPALREDVPHDEPQRFPLHDAPAPQESRTGAEDAPVGDALAVDSAHMRELGSAVVAEGVSQRSAGHLRGALGALATVVSRVGRGRAHDVDEAAAPEAPSAVEPDETAAPSTPLLAPPDALRTTRPALRAEATLDTAGSTALAPSSDGRTMLPEGRELRRPGSVDLVFERVELGDRVRPISTLGEPVEPLVIDGYPTEPAYDPVIGPELTAARTRLGLSVDDVAERTRIRPHVIESIEVDDFGPCGGDFYARGHLRTLARILGKDPAPLLELFEQRYATAPVNPRRVFEAELATGMTGSMRATVGGPNWGLLIGAVLVLVLLWGVARLFTTDPSSTVEIPAPALDSSAVVEPAPAAQPLAQSRPAAKPVGVRLTASQSDSHVVVRDGSGKVVFSGVLVLGERKQLDVVPPVRIVARDGGAVEARVAGRDRGLLGEAGEPARRTFR